MGTSQPLETAMNLRLRLGPKGRQTTASSSISLIHLQKGSFAPSLWPAHFKSLKHQQLDGVWAREELKCIFPIHFSIRTFSRTYLQDFNGIHSTTADFLWCKPNKINSYSHSQLDSRLGHGFQLFSPGLTSGSASGKGYICMLGTACDSGRPITSIRPMIPVTYTYK